MGKTHELKINWIFFSSVSDGYKTFEVRKEDRDFSIGDYIKLNEIDFYDNPTGKSCLCEITYILRGEEYCKAGYCILGIKKLGRWEKRDDYLEYCSECGKSRAVSYPNYCSYCGCKMIMGDD